MTVASFADFFGELNVRPDGSPMTPFPWQERLAESVAASKQWPHEIVIPTGLGKTACIDIAVWALAVAAESTRREAPTRIWYVVDRRLLIDAAFDRGKRLAAALRRPRASQAAVASVAEALRGISRYGAGGAPLHTVRLRGGADIGQRALDPSQPCVIFSTVAMFASRLLFRGYGTSRLMRPVDAALAGTDSLVLLDEAHIAKPLIRVVQHAAVCDVGDPASLLPARRARPTLVPLTATGERVEGSFDLDEADLKDETVRQRLTAAKPTVLRKSSQATLARDLAKAALECIGGLTPPWCSATRRGSRVRSSILS